MSVLQIGFSWSYDESKIKLLFEPFWLSAYLSLYHKYYKIKTVQELTIWSCHTFSFQKPMAEAKIILICRRVVQTYYQRLGCQWMNQRSLTDLALICFLSWPHETQDWCRRAFELLTVDSEAQLHFASQWKILLALLSTWWTELCPFEISCRQVGLSFEISR